MKYKVLSLPSGKREKREVTINREVLIPPGLLRFCEGKKAYIATYGCQANERDGEIITDLLVKCGYQLTTEFEQADLILFNTCAIRKMAENRIVGELGRAKRVKAERGALVIVSGCMSQEKTNIDEFTRRGVADIILGPFNLHRLPELIFDYYQNQQKIVAVLGQAEAVNEIVTDYRESSFKAYVQIMQGCDRFCSYCIVPYVRGKEISRKRADIINELNQLLAQNYRQVTLVGQNVNAYGKGSDYQFADLLEEVAQMPFDRIRFITSNVYDFNDRIIEILARYPRLMPHIHLPLQSGDDQVLKAMNRQYDFAEFAELYFKLRRKIANLSITTDIIVGFPGEDEEAFLATYRAVEQLRFDGAYTFLFSPRPGTAAIRLTDNEPEAAKKERLYRLNESVERIAKEINKELEGTIVEVMVEEVVTNENTLQVKGYTPSNKLVHFDTTVPFEPGDLCWVQITEARPWSLTGELLFDQTMTALADRINGELLEDEIVQNYHHWLKLVRENQQLQELEEQIKTIKKAIVKSSVAGDPEREALMKEKENLEQQYHTHPLINNFRHSYDQLQDLLQQIQSLLKV